MIAPGIFHIEFEGMLLILNLLPVEPLLIKVVTSIYKRWTIPSLLSGLASISFMNEVCVIARINLKVASEYDQELPNFSNYRQTHGIVRKSQQS